MLIFSFYPFIFPNNIFKPIYGVYGYSFLCFIIIGKRIQFEEWALQVTFAYYISIIYIHAVFLGGFKYYKYFRYSKLIYIINLLLIFIFWIGGIYINIRFIGESIRWPYLFFTPIFVIIPIILKIIVIFRTYIDQDKVEREALIDENVQNLNIILQEK